MSAAPQIPDLEAATDALDLARLLRIPASALGACSGKGKVRYYHKLTISKRSQRGSRIVYEVDDPLNRIHKILFLWLVQRAQPFFQNNPCIQGFVKNRSYITNASLHVGRAVVTVVDIRDFFGSIPISQIATSLQRLGCTEMVASVLADLLTLDETLPPGARCSPILSNLACQSLDCRLKELANARELTFSRYADDITFSGENAADFGEISDVLRLEGFSVRDRSYRVMRRGRPQIVTGLCVSDAALVRIPRAKKRWLRLTMHYAKAGFAEHAAVVSRDEQEEMNRIAGYVHYVASVEPQLRERLYQELSLVRSAFEAARAAKRAPRSGH